MIAQLKGEYPVRTLGEALDGPVSTLYYRSIKADESQLVAAAEQILLRFPCYGYRELSKAPARQGHPIGEHVTRRLLRQLGMSRSVRQVRIQTTDSHRAHPRYPNRIKGLKLSAPDQVWVADITYIRLGWRFIYLAVILDVYTRAVRGWALSRSLSQQLTLNQALHERIPLIFHSDQGSQYTAWLHTERLLQWGYRSVCRTKPIRPRMGSSSASRERSRRSMSITASTRTLTMLTSS
jgi:putative transposase